MNQGNREPRNKPTNLWSINLQQRKQEYTVGKDSLFSKWCWKSGTAPYKSMKLEHIFSPYAKTNSKWLKDLNIRQDAINFLEEIIDKTFSSINCTTVFLSQYPK